MSSKDFPQDQSKAHQRTRLTRLYVTTVAQQHSEYSDLNTDI